MIQRGGYVMVAAADIRRDGLSGIYKKTKGLTK